MRKIIPLIASYFIVSSAFASEVILKSAEIKLILLDVVLQGENSVPHFSQIFQKSGATFYNTGGGQSQGSWKVEGDQYCSVWPPNPTWACYNVARDGDKVTFITNSGKRTEMSLTK
jgi:hypothetical protein